MRERVERQKENQQKNTHKNTLSYPENNLRYEQMQTQRASNSSKEEVWKDTLEGKDGYFWLSL